ncbi:hypothetical protein [Pantoea ananatis]|uniref:hypothetical protein n=1 Tax=Pantoea ananas TaxID=553 RepID=UPI0021E85901|nr:hypothetical protein [Pantoea ananatis]MCW0309889.1 hypothetical protein [Pantoea ananatis]MCW0341629.1 hypothetical protein [Pantoea ananatis]MCW0360129.1 hypothetical protein [Pantoea ananatis]MCW0364724.1 hypothetical protein [Pantoea ananatis]MCW1777376.1 hypothetical protein [Pantoea ananatis]
MNIPPDDHFFERDYFASAKNTAISKKRALLELKRHHIVDPTEFYQQMGELDIYQAQDVLTFLGY